MKTYLDIARADNIKISALLSVLEPSRETEARQWTEEERAEFQTLATVRIARLTMWGLGSICGPSPAEHDEIDLLTTLLED